VRRSDHVHNTERPTLVRSKERGSFMRKAIAVTLVVGLLHCSLASAVLAEENTGNVEERTQSTGTQFGLGAASFFLTLPYGIVKVVYATLGGIIGGLTYALTAGNENAANAVWDTSLRGTYVITPDHLKGNKPVRFFGVPADAEAENAEEPVVQPTTEPVPPMPAK
jgi:hypothetical protein